MESITNRHGQNLSDELFKDVIEGYFKDQEARGLFRSAVGPLISSIETLTMHSLISLRQNTSHDEDNNATVTGVLSRLASLLTKW